MVDAADPGCSKRIVLIFASRVAILLSSASFVSPNLGCSSANSLYSFTMAL